MRCFPVVLLILLQALAPVLHAHVGGDHAGRGLHVHAIGAELAGQSLAGISSAPGLEVRVSRALAPRAEPLRTAATPLPDLLPGQAFPALQWQPGRIIARSIPADSPAPCRRGPGQHPSRAPPFA